MNGFARADNSQGGALPSWFIFASRVRDAATELADEAGPIARALAHRRIEPVARCTAAVDFVLDV